MKRGTPRHPKMAEFAGELGVTIYAAIGIMESLWHWTADFAPRGDIGRFPNRAIAAGIGWDGEAEKLVDALTHARWIDSSDEHRLVVHGWAEHCDDGVHLRLARAGQKFADGTPPKISKLTKAERRALSQRKHDVGTAGARQGHDMPPADAPPMPSPMPLPMPEPKPSPAPTPCGGGGNGQPHPCVAYLTSLRVFGGNAQKLVAEHPSWTVDRLRCEIAKLSNQSPGVIVDHLRAVGDMAGVSVATAPPKYRIDR